MPLQAALTDLYLTSGDLEHARPEAQRFVEISLATAEHTWQARAWEAGARVVLAAHNLIRAKECVLNAIAPANGFNVPLSRWRVEATAARVHALDSNADAAVRFRLASAHHIQELAGSLEESDPLKNIFLSSAAVRAVLAP